MTQQPRDTSDETVFRGWLASGILHPPMVTLQWPGGDAVVKKQPGAVHEWQWHLWMDHGIWYNSSRDLRRLENWHIEAHDDPLWSWLLSPGCIVHVHGDAVEEGEETWAW